MKRGLQLCQSFSRTFATRAFILLESDFTPELLATEMQRLLAAPASLAAMAQAARRAGKADAAEALADIVVRVAQIG